MTAPIIVQYAFDEAAATLADDPIPGHLLLSFTAARGGGTTDPPTSPAFTEIREEVYASNPISLGYRIVQPGDGPTITGGATNKILIVEIANGVIDADAGVSNGGPSAVTGNGGTLTPTGGVPALLFSFIAAGGDFGYLGVAADAGITELNDEFGFSPGHWVGYKEVGSTSGAYTLGGTFVAGPDDFAGISVAILGAEDPVTETEDLSTTCCMGSGTPYGQWHGFLRVRGSIGPGSVTVYGGGVALDSHTWTGPEATAGVSETLDLGAYASGSFVAEWTHLPATIMEMPWDATKLAAGESVRSISLRRPTEP